MRSKSPSPHLPPLTWEDSAHGGEGIDLEGVHLPLGTEAHHFHTHKQEAHGQKTNVRELTDDWEPEDTWKHWLAEEYILCDRT